MNRFMGMMPTSEIEKTGDFKDNYGMKIHIDAGKNGWTILYADNSSQYEDIIDTSENNFNSALNMLKSRLKVTEINEEE